MTRLVALERHFDHATLVDIYNIFDNFHVVIFGLK